MDEDNWVSFRIHLNFKSSRSMASFLVVVIHIQIPAFDHVSSLLDEIRMLNPFFLVVNPFPKFLNWGRSRSEAADTTISWSSTGNSKNCPACVKSVPQPNFNKHSQDAIQTVDERHCASSSLNTSPILLHGRDRAKMFLWGITQRHPGGRYVIPSSIDKNSTTTTKHILTSDIQEPTKQKPTTNKSNNT